MDEIFYEGGQLTAAPPPMDKVHELNQLRLRLSPDTEIRTLSDGAQLLKQRRRLEYLALPPELAPVLTRFTGDATVEAILRQLLHEPGRPEIRAFYDLVVTARDKGFLAEMSPAPAPAAPQPFPWTTGWRIGVVLAQVVILAPAGAWFFTTTEVSMPLTLAGWLWTLFSLAVMLSIGTVLAAGVLRGYGRHAYHSRLAFSAGGIPHFALNLGDGFMGGRLCQAALALQTLSVPLMFAVLSCLLANPDVFFAAWIMLLACLCPFGRTPARALLHLVFHKDYQLPSSLHLFLGKRLFLKLLFSRLKGKEEEYLLIYAIFAMGWLGGVIFFAGERVWQQSGELLDNVFFSPDPLTRSLATVIALLLVLLTIVPLGYQAWLLLRNLYALTLAPLVNTERRTLRRHTGKSQPAAEEVVKLVAGNLLFSHLPAAEQRLIAEAMQWVTLKSGHVIMREGDAGDTLWLLCTGAATVSREDQAGQEHSVATLGPGDVFGEIALLNRVPRTATVRAVGPVEALVLQKEAFERVVVPALGAAKIRTLIQVCAWVKRHSLFADWPSQALLQLASDFDFVDCQPGDVPIRENAANDSFYLVHDGAFEVRRDGRPIATLGPGDFFGEISLLRGIPATADVVATQPSRCLKLGRDKFFACLSQNAITGISVEAALLTRWKPPAKSS